MVLRDEYRLQFSYTSDIALGPIILNIKGLFTSSELKIDDDALHDTASQAIFNVMRLAISCREPHSSHYILHTSTPGCEVNFGVSSKTDYF